LSIVALDGDVTDELQSDERMHSKRHQYTNEEKEAYMTYFDKVKSITRAARDTGVPRKCFSYWIARRHLIFTSRKDAKRNKSESPPSDQLKLTLETKVSLKEKKFLSFYQI
jgi:transposase-like protein